VFLALIERVVTMGNTNPALEPDKKIQSKILVICFALMLVVFVVDLQLPLGVAGGVPYVVVIITALWLKDAMYVYLFAVVCSLLTVAGFFLSPEGGELWKVVVNRFLALFVLWTTSIIAVNWRKSEVQMLNHLLEAEKEIEKKNIYLATMSGAQHITNNLLNGLKLVEMEITKHPTFDKEVVELFDGMLVEADTLMKKLSSVEKIDPDVIKKSVVLTK
jgi:hypothetical protein